MNRAVLFLFLAFSACGYRFDTGEPIAVSVPYVVGDFQGELTDALVSALSHSASFRYTNGTGDWILKAKIKGATNDRIGYRYDRTPKEGERLPNVIGTENRKTISVEVSVVSSATGKQILGPQTIEVAADYDYVDPNSLKDLAFLNPATGEIDTSIAFSLGQLDSVGSAGENAIYPIYNHLAQKIVDGMIASGGWDDDE